MRLVDPNHQRCPEVIIHSKFHVPTIAFNFPLEHPSSLPTESKCCEKKENS
jgi:hypothetical protein